MRADSDVDLALLLTPHATLSPATRLDLAARLALLLDRPADLGLLSSNNLVYASEVANHGRLLFTRSPLTSDRFLAQSLAQYADLQVSRRKILDAYAA